jgi:hypothetical protein
MFPLDDERSARLRVEDDGEGKGDVRKGESFK